MSTAALRVLFAGTPHFAEQHLTALLSSQHQVVAVLTQPDRRAGRGKKLQHSPVKACALAANVPVLQPLTLRDETIAPALTTLNVDVMVVVAYGLLLPDWVLAMPRYGCLNVHASLLPRWRGAAPIQRAVAAGDKVSGVTIMRMDAGLDTGPMLHKVSLRLEPEESGGSLHDKLATVGPGALLEVLNNIETYLANGEIQDDASACYASKITKVETDLDWSLSATTLARRIRAFQPVPGCFSTLSGERIKFHAAQECLGRTSAALPGTLLAINPKGIEVACGEGVLLITRAQFAGGKPLSAVELMNGNRERLIPGARMIQTPSDA